jgi:hypothetical protein
MTTKVKFEYVSGNKAIEVVDAVSGATVATLRGPGDVTEQQVHDGQHFLVHEIGDFYHSEGSGDANDAGLPA